jgi:molybdopterin-guanine dinucleotide biosynthesis protein A
VRVIIENKPPIRDVTAVILAGGRSGRMGFDKALLEFHGQTLLKRQVDLMSHLFAAVLIAGGDLARYPQVPVPTVPDRYPGQGALAGIHAGLREASTERIFVIACDAPFPNDALIRHLVSVAPDADWVVPRTGRGLEPLFAVYGRNCRAAIESQLAAGLRRIIFLSERVSTVFVEEAELRRFDPDLSSFVNINTPEERTRYLGG